MRDEQRRFSTALWPHVCVYRTPLHRYVAELQSLKGVLLAAAAEQEALEKRVAEVGHRYSCDGCCSAGPAVACGECREGAVLALLWLATSARQVQCWPAGGP